MGRLTTPIPRVVVLDAYGQVTTSRVASPILVVLGPDQRVQLRTVRPNLDLGTKPFRWDYVTQHWDVDVQAK